MTEATPQRRGVPIWAQIIVWVLLVGLLAIVALQLRKTQQGSAQPGQLIDNFTLPIYSGYEMNGKSTISLADLRGKVVVVNFWASWCKPCEQEAADLQSAWEVYQPTGKVVFLGVDYVDTEPEARVFLEKFGVTYPVGPDLATKISQYFRITGAPETYFIDQQGVLRYSKIGPFTSVQEVQNILDPMLSQ